MNIKETVFTLSEAYGASGNESPAAEIACGMLREYCPDAEIIGGSVIGTLGENGKTKLLLDAHIDQIGLIVTYITDDGFVKFSNLGGIDRRLLPAQPVVIHGKRDIKGVICSVPPHLTSGASEVLQFDETAIDTGMTKDELSEVVSLGDTVTFDVKCRELIGNRVTGGALDDRCGVASILYALELLKGKDINYHITVVFSSQEELGERGAKIAAERIAPEISLAVDVSFAVAPGENALKCGELGKGAMIGIAPVLSREISEKLIDTAKANNIPYQIEVMSDSTGTNADRYSVGGKNGSKACTISIPLRNMHTPAEVIDLTDVEMTGKLIAEFIAKGE